MEYIIEVNGPKAGPARFVDETGELAAERWKAERFYNRKHALGCAAHYALAEWAEGAVIRVVEYATLDPVRGK